MSKAKERRENGLKLLRFLIILICIGGFLYHSLEFMHLYWTYPTVIDIQQSQPLLFDVPAFTICNTIGYNFTTICEGFEARPCLSSSFNKDLSEEMCNSLDTRFSVCCYDKEVPDDFQGILYNTFSEDVVLKPEDNVRLRVPLREYFKCSIELAGQVRKCNIDYVMGPVYSTQELPQYCYSIYSMWGQPNKTQERIPKGATMKLKFFLNASQSNEIDSDKIRPKHNMPSSPSVQIAVHSPYFLPSPYLEGDNFLGGRAYELRVTLSESHLLPYPYQTNCTDYLDVWRKRGGKAPINQMGVINECKLQKYYNALGCVPLSLEYPHNYSICKSCRGGCDYIVNEEECLRLADSYNQPCATMTYNVMKADKIISFAYKMDSDELESAEGARSKIPYHDCSGNNFWSIECSTVDIDVLFDRFEITVTSYNPKFESLEIFSVIGGYLGMWLGISLVTVYDFAGTLIGIITAYWKKRNDKRKADEKNNFPSNERRRRNSQRPSYS